MIKKIFLIWAIFTAVTMTARAAGNKFVLVIDAGHGGKDIGAPGAYSREKDINLKVTLAFGKLVENNCSDVKVVYTRKKDVFIPLYERAEIANKNKADLFISIHTNAVEKGKQIRGFETYTLGDGKSHATKTNLEVAKRENSVILLEDDYKERYVGYDPNSPESNIMFEFVQDQNLSRSIDFAKMAQKNVCNTAGRPDRGVHQSNLAVLRLTSMPACLIELGYITTPSEEKLLNDKSYIDKIALGIYKAFVEYKAKTFNDIGIDYNSSSAAATVSTEKQTASSKVEENTEKTTQTSQPTVADAANTVSTDDIVFKVQILVTSRALANNDAAFKGLKGCECYIDGGMNKYTYGSSTDYNEIYRLRKKITDKFPEAFIIAFKDGQRIDTVEAITIFKQKQK